MIDILQGVIDQANRNAVTAPEDYEQDGLLYCGQCHTPKECTPNFPVIGRRKVPCLCACGRARLETEREARRHQEEMERIANLRSVAMSAPKFKAARFESADGRNRDTMTKLRNYAASFDRAQAENIGLCLLGNVGTGKSYGAACIANYLLDRGTPVLMTNFARVLNGLSGYDVDKNAYIRDIVKYPLLILDDFGIERSTEYAVEQVYNVVDSRYRTGKPLIVTTNLNWEELKNPGDMAHRRIYDRIVEMCQPVSFGNDGRRKGLAAEKRKIAAELLTVGTAP